MKKIISLFMAFMLIMSVMVTAYALPIDQMVPSNCPKCGGAMEYFGTSEGPLNGPTAQRSCSLCASGYDYRYTRKVTEFYSCNLCYHSMQANKYQTLWICNEMPLER